MPVTLVEFKKAVNSLKQALDLEKNDIVRDATIQRFKFSVELAWKSAKKVMGTSTSAPKQVIREMGQNNMIEDVTYWLQAIDHRNLSVHTYNEDLAEQVYNFAKSFLIEFEKLLNILEQF